MYLKGFLAYGFNYHIIMAKLQENDQMFEEIGILGIGETPFKIGIAPMGPIIHMGHEDLFSSLVSDALSHSRSVGAFLFQLKITFTEKFADPAALPGTTMPTGASHRDGFPFGVMAAPNPRCFG